MESQQHRVGHAAPHDKNLNVVYLVNFLAPDNVSICRHWRKLSGNLFVLVSVPMEGNRKWAPDHDGLNVIVQKTWTQNKRDVHPSGYEDVNYVHFPWDTYHQLRSLRPDVVVTSELGVRSMMAALFCKLNPRTKHVIQVSTSEHIERSRDSWIRRTQRQQLLKCADAVTYHGDSCKRYLKRLGVPGYRLFRWDYSADSSKPYRGELSDRPSARTSIAFLTVGQLIERKGVMTALQQLIGYAKARPALSIHWTLVGGGPQESEMKAIQTPTNLRREYRGNCNADQIRDAYRDHELMLFPTLGDEWGLVVDEAMHSGLVVLGSDKAPACECLIEDGVNGFVYNPDDEATLWKRLDHWGSMESREKLSMRSTARLSVLDRTPQCSAIQIANVISRLGVSNR